MGWLLEVAKEKEKKIKPDLEKVKLKVLTLVQFQELRSPELSRPAPPSWGCILNLCTPLSNLLIIAMFPTLGCVIPHQWSIVKESSWLSQTTWQKQLKERFVDPWIQSVTVCLPREDQAELLCSGVRRGSQLVRRTQGKRRKVGGG